MNILRLLYEKSPMNFYQYIGNSETVIKSIENPNLGYNFAKQFDETDIGEIWKRIHFHKKISAIGIFVIFVSIMYGIVFPNFTFFVKQVWYVNVLIILALLFVIYKIIININTKIFEKNLKKTFGEFSIIKITKNKFFDKKFYDLFISELVKISVLLVVLGLFALLFSPLKITMKYIENQEYKKVENLTTAGMIVFPILPDWYSLRGYAKFQQEDYEGAIKDYDKAYRLGADVFNAMNFDNKIFIKYYLKDYKGALQDFDNEIKNSDNEYEKDALLWDKAQFLYNIGKYTDALDLYTQLLSKADSDSVFLLKDRLYLERAQIYQKLGQTDLAQADLNNSESLDSLDDVLDAIPKPTLILNEL